MFGLFHSHTLPELFWHTDVHSHVCPGIDDGAPTREKSVQLVRGMADMGFTRMIVTPHVTDETYPNTPQTISLSFQHLRHACSEAGLPMELHCSAEYRIDDILFSMLKQDTVTPLPGGYLLVENSWFQEPFGLDGLLFDLRNEKGLKPIMAHPERYAYYQRHRERLEELHANNVCLQVNLLSLAGHYGRTAKSTAEWLLSHDMVSFVGSDLHRMGHLDAIKRYLCSRDYRKLESKCDLILNDTLVE
jgi:protein-tyrosine phosphatase